MSYACLDDHWDEHPKYVDLELEHFGLMACGIVYCNRNLTDGFVPEKAVRGFGASGKGIRLAERLVTSGQWAKTDGGYQIVGYLDHNPSKEQVLARRAERADAGRRGGFARARVVATATAPAMATAKANAMAPAMAVANTNVVPSPILSDPTQSNPKKRRESETPQAAPTPPKDPKGSRLPDDYAPSAALVAALRDELRVDALAAVPAFKDYWRAATGAKARKADWDATFRNWVRRDSDRLPPWTPPAKAADDGPKYDGTETAAPKAFLDALDALAAKEASPVTVGAAVRWTAKPKGGES